METQASLLISRQEQQQGISTRVRAGAFLTEVGVVGDNRAQSRGCCHRCIDCPVLCFRSEVWCTLESQHCNSRLSSSRSRQSFERLRPTCAATGRGVLPAVIHGQT